MNTVLLKIAVRNLTRNKRRSAITLSALFFGVFMILLMEGLALGFATMTTENVVETRTGAIQVHKLGYFENLAGNPAALHFQYDLELVEKLKAIPGVRGVAGRLNFAGQISNARNQAPVLGTGYDIEAEEKVCVRSGTAFEPGSAALESGDANALLIGRELAASLDTVLAPSKNNASDGSGQGAGAEAPTLVVSGASPLGRQNSQDFRVKGIFKAANAFEEKRIVSLTLQSAQELIGLPNQVTEIAIGLNSIHDLPQILEQVKKTVGADFEVHTWADLQPFIRDILFRQQIGISIMAVALFIMVLFLIVNTMLMAVFERIKEMGTMMALGIRQSQILSIFLYEAVTLGVIAATLGCLVGVGVVSALGWVGFPFGTAAFEVQILRPEVSAEIVLFTWLLAIACSAVAGTYPAVKASRLNPVDALRAT